jgi:hypothetical protein
MDELEVSNLDQILSSHFAEKKDVIDAFKQISVPFAKRLTDLLDTHAPDNARSAKDLRPKYKAERMLKLFDHSRIIIKDANEVRFTMLKSGRMSSAEIEATEAEWREVDEFIDKAGKMENRGRWDRQNMPTAKWYGLISRSDIRTASTYITHIDIPTISAHKPQVVKDFEVAQASDVATNGHAALSRRIELGTRSKVFDDNRREEAFTPSVPVAQGALPVSVTSGTSKMERHTLHGGGIAIGVDETLNYFGFKLPTRDRWTWMDMGRIFEMLTMWDEYSDGYIQGVIDEFEQIMWEKLDDPGYEGIVDLDEVISNVTGFQVLMDMTLAQQDNGETNLGAAFAMIIWRGVMDGGKLKGLTLKVPTTTLRSSHAMAQAGQSGRGTIKLPRHRLGTRDRGDDEGDVAYLRWIDAEKTRKPGEIPKWLGTKKLWGVPTFSQTGEEWNPNIKENERWARKDERTIPMKTSGMVFLGHGEHSQNTSIVAQIVSKVDWDTVKAILAYEREKGELIDPMTWANVVETLPVAYTGILRVLHDEDKGEMEFEAGWPHDSGAGNALTTLDSSRAAQVIGMQSGSHLSFMPKEGGHGTKVQSGMFYDDGQIIAGINCAGSTGSMQNVGWQATLNDDGEFSRISETTANEDAEVCRAIMEARLSGAKFNGVDVGVNRSIVSKSGWTYRLVEELWSERQVKKDDMRKIVYDYMYEWCGVMAAAYGEDFNKWVSVIYAKLGLTRPAPHSVLEPNARRIFGKAAFDSLVTLVDAMWITTHRSGRTKVHSSSSEISLVRLILSDMSTFKFATEAPSRGQTRVSKQRIREMALPYTLISQNKLRLMSCNFATLNAVRTQGEWTRITGSRMPGEPRNYKTATNFTDWKDEIGTYKEFSNRLEPMRIGGFVNDVEAIVKWYEQKGIINASGDSIERGSLARAHDWIGQHGPDITLDQTEWIEEMGAVDMGPLLDCFDERNADGASLCRQVKYDRMTSPLVGSIHVYDSKGRVHILDALVNQALRTHALSAGLQLVETYQGDLTPHLSGVGINGNINIGLVKRRCKRVGIVRTPDFTIFTGLRVELSWTGDIARIKLYAHILPEITASAFNIATLDTKRIVRSTTTEGDRVDFYPGSAEVPFYVESFFKKPEDPVRSLLERV